MRELDPEYYRQVDTKNPARVLRALEVCLSTGQPYSSLRIGEPHERPFRIVMIGTQMERAELYRRIDRRVDEMMAAGLEQEARAVYPYRHLNSLQTVGYKELFDYFDGKITREEAVELIKRNTRRYAKRQMTWFRRDRRIAWFEPTHRDEIVRHIEKQIFAD